MKRKRRLLTLGHSYGVGVNRRLAHEMARAGEGEWDVTTAAPTFFHGANDLRPVRLELGPGEEGSVLPLGTLFTRRVHVFLYEPKLRSVLTKDWDFIHCWEEPYIFAGWQVATLAPKRTPLVFHTCQNLSKHYPPPFSFIERYSMGRAAGLLCCGETVVQTLKDRHGYENKPMRPIPFGVDPEKFFPDAASRKATLQTLGWDDAGPPVVGYLGRFLPDKGLSVLMGALDTVRAPWRALFVGAGAMEPELRRWASRYPDKVRICNDVKHDAVPAYLRAMDMLCAPSQTTPRWREQFGRMLVEGFASGVPVVGSDSGEIPHVVGKAGSIVAEGDVGAWAKTIEELLESPARRATMREEGLEVAAKKYAWPVVARKHLDFFEAILQGGGGGGRGADN
ncbi:glycosyltransferase family 4 protein [Pendulispora albinea]|uniref:Glycosyltransferase family 4 protein n=1 Tax=Pendulispora albinea TaxID=2741071 RepID=A0ABZ2LRA9_9BACT